MSVSEIFGQVLTAHDVEQAALTTLQAWLPATVAEIERQKAITPMTISLPRSWEILSESAEAWPEDQLPAVIVVSPGFAEAPIRQGSGFYRASFELQVEVICSASTQDDTRQLAQLYAAAAMLVLAQHRSLGGFAADLRPTDLGADVQFNDKRRSVAAWIASFVVEVDQLFTTDGPVGEPPADPYATPEDWPVVESTVIATERIP